MQYSYDVATNVVRGILDDTTREIGIGGKEVSRLKELLYALEIHAMDPDLVVKEAGCIRNSVFPRPRSCQPWFDKTV